MNVDPLYKRIGAIIARRRKALDISQEELAPLIRISRASLANIERGRQRLLVHQLYPLAEALNLQPSDLLPVVEAESAAAAAEQIKLPSDLSARQRADIAKLIGGIDTQPKQEATPRAKKNK